MSNFVLGYIGMPLTKSLAEPKIIRALSPVWIILYLALHMLCNQLVVGPYIFAELRLAFILLVCTTLFTQGRHDWIPHYFIGRWLPRSKQWMMVVFFILATLGARIVLQHYFRSTHQLLSGKYVIDYIVIPPINEELIFRGLFLGILFSSMPRSRWAAVALSALIFVSVHTNICSFGFLVDLAVLGLLCGSCFAVTECVPACIVCHALWNAFPLFIVQ